MTTVPMGHGAYKRLYAGAPEIEMLNRRLEAAPGNPVESVSVLARPGTTELLELDPGDWLGPGAIRGCYSLNGLFDNSLFVVCGTKLYRINESMVVVEVTGALTGTGHPEVAWQRGIDYQRLWICDGGRLWYVDTDTPDTLQECSVPDDQIPLSLTQIDSYVLVSIADTQVFYWINPAEVTIDPLNFASKESSPDNIIALRAFSNQVGIIGEKSFENWYATGNLDAPFAPIDGRVYSRGMIEGTGIVVNDGVIMVGEDGRVYSIGFQSGDSQDVGWGTVRISNNGIEERIRRQIRREAGLTP